jgi:hypothetical protein
MNWYLLIYYIILAIIMTGFICLLNYILKRHAGQNNIIAGKIRQIKKKRLKRKIIKSLNQYKSKK